jgi:hypothetical protein
MAAASSGDSVVPYPQHDDECGQGKQGNEGKGIVAQKILIHDKS